MKWTLCYCHNLRPIAILGFVVISIPLFTGIAYICSLFVPYTIINSVMVETQCQLIDTRISTRNTTVITCLNLFEDCESNHTLAYQKTDIYSFSDTHNNHQYTTDISGNWQTEYPSPPSSSDDKWLTCYYNRCMISDECDPRGQPLLTFRLESAFDDYSMTMTVTILTVACLLIVISLVLLVVLYYSYKPRSGSIII